MLSFKEWFELNEGKKDACYHKVKSRYRVWPSAYASASLVRCRKVGASNWGNSKNESVECYFCTDQATSIEMWDEEIPVCDACSASVSEGTFDLEKKRGLRGWFDRNHGKGWIDCKKSSKGNLVPCGRKTAGKGAERSYPACRPTLSACTSKGIKSKKSSKSVDWK